MNRIVRLTVIAALCICGVSLCANAKGYDNALKAPKPKVDAKGYFSLQDCPRSIPNVEVTTELEDDGRYLVNISINGVKMDKIYSNASTGDVRFVDGNFDGYYDILVGPATSRNYSMLYLWDIKNQFFYLANTTDDLNGYFLLNPARKQWVGRGSSSYCSLYYTIFKWEDGKEVDIESLIHISDSMVFHEYGVKKFYTVIKGGDFENVSRNLKMHTNKKSALSKVWLTIIAEFDKYIK